eukprot:365734-Chlamydomonas_euryale.AAC.13
MLLALYAMTMLQDVQHTAGSGTHSGVQLMMLRRSSRDSDRSIVPSMACWAKHRSPSETNLQMASLLTSCTTLFHLPHRQ